MILNYNNLIDIYQSLGIKLCILPMIRRGCGVHSWSRSRNFRVVLSDLPGSRNPESHLLRVRDCRGGDTSTDLRPEHRQKVLSKESVLVSLQFRQNVLGDEAVAAIANAQPPVFDVSDRVAGDGTTDLGAQIAALAPMLTQPQ